MKKLSLLLILAAGCLWGTMGLFVHTLEDAGLSTMLMVVIRAAITSVVLFVGIAMVKPSLLRVNPKHLWCFFGTGICSVVFFNVCYIRTIAATSMSVAAVLMYTSPIFVMLLCRLLFQEAFTARKWLALGLAFSGCLLVSGILLGNAPLTPLGFLTGIGSGFGYGLYSIFSRYAMRYGYSGWTITAYTFLFAAVGGAVFCDFGTLATAVQTRGGFAIWFFLLFAATTTLLPYLCYTIGLQRTDTSKASVIVSIELVVASLNGFLFYREIPSVSTVLGILLVLAAVVTASMPSKAKVHDR